VLSEEDVQSMVRAGLTYSQARIYLTLVIIGRTSTKTISQTARVDPANTQRVLLSLQKLCLVNRIIGNPNLYEAIPIKDGVRLLLERKAGDYAEVVRATNFLAEHFEGLSQQPPEVENNIFVIVPPKTAYVNMSISNFNKAKETIDLISTQKRSAQSKDYYRQAQTKALERGVRIRQIKEKPSDLKETNQSSNRREFPNLHKKVVQELPKVVGGIFDDKIATFLIYPNANYMESPCLLTNHPGFILMYRNYFDKLWEKAEDDLS
jgi:sugar-specific transcriptional regulator TrmB